MKETLVKFTIYILSLIVCVTLFVKVGSEIFVQIAMLYEGVPERDLLTKESGLAQVGIILLIPEILFGAIGGWY